ncbi:ribonuclease P protein component [Spirosoma soli]|uniref:Ribonuclease P protein component n=1 Tax=Spirosoma soli TaxID=1770529 RepID=A0ABW5LZ39_9BACT
MQQTFTKSERLCSKKILSELFKKGSTSESPGANRTFYLFPFRVLYIPHPQPASTTPPAPELQLPAIVITVPKRVFKRAVDRNLVRRRVREAYRLHKHLLSQAKTPPASIAFLYTAKQIISFEEIEKGMKLAIKKF